MKKRALYIVAFLVAAVLLSVVSGCGRKKPDGFPKIYPCNVKITQGGAPLAGAAITLLPTEKAGSRSWVISGTTDDSGVAKIMTETYFVGAPAGKYAVTVTKISSDWSHAAKTVEEYDAMQERGEESTFTTTYSVAPEFADPRQSGLEAQVNEGTNEFTFDVGEPFENVIEENFKPN